MNLRHFACAVVGLAVVLAACSTGVAPEPSGSSAPTTLARAFDLQRTLLTGQLVDETGRPVNGGSIEVMVDEDFGWRSRATSGRYRTIGATRSGADGRFVVMLDPTFAAVDDPRLIEAPAADPPFTNFTVVAFGPGLFGQWGWPGTLMDSPEGRRWAPTVGGDGSSSGRPASTIIVMQPQSPLPPDRFVMAQSRWTPVAIVVVLTLGAAGFAVRWFTATPTILSPCRGVLDPENRDRPVPFTVAGSSDGAEYRVPVAREGRVALFLCPTSTTPIEVLDVRLPVRPEQYSLIRPDTPHAVDLDRGGVEIAAAPALQPYRVGPDRPDRQVALLFRFDDCERFETGSSLGLDHFEVDYRYRGRERTTRIAIGGRYSFVSPPDADCPERANIPPPTGPPALETDVTKPPPT